MRIDLTPATAAAVPTDAGQGATPANQAQRSAATNRNNQTGQASSQTRSSNLAQNPSAQQTAKAEPPVHVPPAVRAPEVMNVSFDQNRNTVYRFTDEKTGELVRQVPPEEVLRVMRSVEDMLQESEQKLKVTL